MAENIEETVKVHVEDKTERDVLTGDFIRKRPKPATAYAEGLFRRISLLIRRLRSRLILLKRK
uniref:Uncharacterized protein n=1 Tax=Amphimedon queenslandica TaxID=400682 RepID=A0A1X7UPZ0_AMPQE